MTRILAITCDRSDTAPMRRVIDAIDWCRHFELVARINDPVSRMGDMVVQATNAIEGWRPDLVLLLGDRYETLAAAMAATVARVPIAHIHGGEASFGSFDNQLRDAISKLAHIHFVATKGARCRLEDLGEDTDRILLVGAPGLDNIDLEQLGPRKAKPEFVVTYHPETLGSGAAGIRDLFLALESFPGYDVIWTGSNTDPGAREINAAAMMANRTIYSLAPAESPFAYHYACRHAAAVIGNSSSGIIECPTLEVPTVNIGTRQDGREKGPSVFDCNADPLVIAHTIRKAIEYDGPFDNPYGGPGASAKIAALLKDANLDGIMVKRW